MNIDSANDILLIHTPGYRNMRTIGKFAIAAFVLFFLTTTGNARHIIGGVMTYRCISPGNYEFTLKMYRDCNCTDCANFDPTAFVGVYRCPGGNCSGQSQGAPFRRVDVPLGSVRQVTAPSYPCLIPPNVCVQEAEYVFNLSLPVSTTDSYHITYQRCCRNETINNIFAPSTVGATYTVEITSAAQQLCNNSPTFNTFPPTVICGGLPLSYDHAATDADGDSLVYRFSAPLLGGGNLLTSPAYQTCAGAYPNPGCPPPYNPVSFIVPTYTPTAPMAGNPVVTIDSQTGLISGTPVNLGQYVVGVQVLEYRNGVLLSTVFRDFQFNVARCDPTVVAQIQSDSIADGQSYFINACGDTAVTIVNTSFQQAFVTNFLWRFNISGNTVTSNSWNPTINFPGPGRYTGELFLNPGTNCGDTARVTINVFPSISADFSFAYDTCVAGPVQFTDLSMSGSGNIVAWDWQFGDGQRSSARNPAHTYRIPGNIPVTLTVTDVNGCQASITKVVPYFPVPSLIVIAPSAFTGCRPAEIFFDNLSFPIDETYDILWEFGDGATGTAISPTHTYTETGVYTVSVRIISPIGCRTDTVFNSLIRVLPSPVAGFEYTPDDPTSINNTVIFSDRSEGANRWFWDFGNGANSILSNPSHVYRDTGMFVVTQVVTHPSGCRDTATQIVDIRPEVRFHLPNAFTPNADGLNDTYKGVGIMEGARAFNMSIWNRWGEMVFETESPNEGWNGRKFNTGQDSPPGVYVVYVRFWGPRGEPFEIKGFATLIR